MSDYNKRGFHDDSKGRKLLQAVSEGGRLHELINLVNQDKDLVIQIRDNYFNIYYRGGNVAKVNSPDSVELDKNYFRKQENRGLEDWDKIKEDKAFAVDLFRKGRFKEYLDYVTTEMTGYWTDIIKGRGLEEKNCQHRICLDNDSGKSDYTIIDLEYEVSTRSLFRYRGARKTGKDKAPSPRFDIVAVRNSDGRLCIIELKKGTGALAGKSGVQEHAESFHNTVDYDESTRKAFVEELNAVVELKKKLGLTDKSVFVDTDKAPEYMFAYQFSSSDKYPTFEDQKRTFRKYQNETTHTDGVNYAKGMKVIWLDKDEYCLKDK